MSNAKILIIKTGLIETLTFPDGSSYESAIRKKPVSMVKVHTLGAEGNDVGLKAHHGGVGANGGGNAVQCAGQRTVFQRNHQ